MKRMRLLFAGTILFIVSLQGTCLAQQEAAAVVPPPQPGPDQGGDFETTPAWQDEFDYSGLPDPAKWSFMTGGHGWGNNELQYYTDRIDNAFVGNGVLTIAARKENKGGMKFTSARMTSKGKGDFLYGRFEIRAQLPMGRGTWPALWMLPTGNTYGDWPRSGEIDIMEHVGFDPGNVHITMHTEAYNHRINTQRGRIGKVDDVSQFHLYRVDWTPGSIRGYIDDELVLDFPNEGTGSKAWPFDQPFHFLMNIAVGGDWGGKEGVDATVFPAKMEVDYVRAYKLIGH